MSTQTPSHFGGPVSTVPPDSKRSKAPAEFTRAASVLDLARDADPAIADALEEPHVALDAYGRILGISEPIAHRLGFQVARMIGRRLRHRVLGADRARFQAMLAPARTAQLPSPIDVRLRANDEEVVEAALIPLAVTSAGGSVVVVFRVALIALPELGGSLPSTPRAAGKFA